jgi:hypothetical protein
MSKPEQFTSMEQKRPKNRGSQLLVIVSLLVTVLGALLAVDGRWFGFVVLAAGLLTLIAGMAWSVRHWDF